VYQMTSLSSAKNFSHPSPTGNCPGFLSRVVAEASPPRSIFIFPKCNDPGEAKNGWSFENGWRGVRSHPSVFDAKTASGRTWSLRESRNFGSPGPASGCYGRTLYTANVNVGKQF
jgi:hypothetical protein